MEPKYDTIHRALVNQAGAQSHVLTHIIRVQLPGGRIVPLRLRIRMNAYEEQSWGKVEVYEDGAWQEVHSVSGYEIPRADFSYVSKPDERVFAAPERELFATAFAILGLS